MSTSVAKRATVLVSGIAGLGMQAGALEPEDILHFRVGNLHIRPQFSTGVTVDDNIFYRSSDALNELLYGAKEGDLISQLGSGANITLGQDSVNTLSFGYNYLHRFYADHSEVSSGDHALSLSGGLTQGKVRFSTSHALTYLTGIQGGGTSFLVEQNPRISLSDQLSVSFDITPKSDVYVTGSYSQTDQDEDSRFSDFDSWRLAMGYGFKYSEGLRMFTQLRHGISTTSYYRSTSERSWDFTGASMGAEGDFTEKLTGTLQVGYELRSSDLTGISAGAPTVTAELEQLLGERTLLALSYTRANQVNVDLADQASVSDSVRLTLRRALGTRQKWFASVFGGLFLNDFSEPGGSNEGASFESFSFGGSLDYRVQEWLSSSLSYSFSDFSAEFPASNRSSIDYQVNQVSMSAKFGF
ncbi:MAG: hypothetical protein P8L18_07175 [Verrucomicrobiota bacterium]|nr:hypothetical protein [Verrucomicrobiota bacterium]